MDFFRKYQRVILYTAGIFALVSFSISAPILGFFDSLFRKQLPNPTMRIGDKVVDVTVEDLGIGSQVAMLQRFLPTIVMPNFVPEDEDSNRREIYAAVRRLAIHYGIEISEDEVGRAIQQAVDIVPAAESALDLARIARLTSVGELQKLIGESLRMGTFLRLQALAADVTDASLAEQLVRDQEFLMLDIATLDEEALQKELESEEVADETLTAWVTDLEDFDRRSRGYLGDPLYRLQLAYAELAAFDPAAYAAELGDKEFSDDEVDNFYVMNRAALFLKPKEEKSEDKQEEGDPKKDEEPTDADQDVVEEKPEDDYLALDDALKASIRKRLAAEAVLRKIWDQVGERFRAAQTAGNEAIEAAQVAVEEKQTARGAAAERGEAADATEDEKAALAAADEAITAAKAAVTAAEEALVTIRKDFDAKAAFEELAAGRAGVGVLDTGEELLSAAKIGELAPIAPWKGVITVTESQPLSTQVQRSPSAVFHTRLVAADLTPLRPLDEIRDKVRADYFRKRAEDLAQERSDAFEKAIKDLALARATEEVQKVETARDERVEKEFGEWRTGVETSLEEARKTLEGLGGSDPNRRVYKAASDRVAKLEAELAGADAKRTEITEAEQKTADDEIADIAKAKYGEVLAEAATANGFAVASFGPFKRDLSRTGTPRESFPKPIRYVFWSGDTSNLDKGEATDLLQDFTGRARHLAVITDVQKGDLASITRRQLLQARAAEAGMRRVTALGQSFTLDAIKQRYGWQAPSESVAEPGDR
ncbi:MAG: hypothetical protein ACO4CT_01710 [Planctomycetota bacterium]